jgi:uncharacterized protein (DUF736 family)
MSVRINPADRVVVTNFRYAPGSAISVFSLSDVDATISSIRDGNILRWDNMSGKFKAEDLTLEGGIYNGVGSLGDQTIQIRYSDVWKTPVALEKAELAYSLLPDSFNPATGTWTGGDTLYIGSEDGTPIPIASKRLYDYLNHTDGIVQPNSAVTTNSDGGVDQLTIGQIQISDSTLSVTNAGNNLYLSPGGLANISATNHRIIDVADPVDPQDALTLNYLQTQYSQTLNVVVDGSAADAINLKSQTLNFASSNTVSVVYDAATNTLSLDAIIPPATANAVIVVSNTAPASPIVGTAWYDQDDTGRTYVWDGTQWIDMAPSLGGGSSNTVISISATAPANPYPGMPWYCTANTSGFIWNGSSWVLFSDPDHGYPHSTIANTAPSSPKSGDLWIDSADYNHLYAWNGFDWIDVWPQPEQNGLILIANTAPVGVKIGTAWYDEDGTGRTYVWDGSQWIDIAPQAITTAPSTANATITISNTAPANPYVGMPWYCEANTSGFIWNGTTWTLFSDPDSGYPHSIIANTAPLNRANGDIWVDTANGANHPYVWDGSQWMDIIPGIDNKAIITIANTAPANSTIGAAWYDQDDTGRTYVWDGTQWVDIAPNSLIPPQKQPLVFASTSAAPIPETGYLWYNTDDNITYSWTGAAWVNIANTSNSSLIIVSNTAPSNPDIGTAWYDEDDTGRTYVWDGIQWVDIAPPTSSDIPNLILIANSPPINVDAGTAWYDADNTGRTYVWDGTQWVDVAPVPVLNSPSYIITKSIPDLSIYTNAVAYVIVPTGVKSITVQIEDYSTTSNAGTVGWKIDGITDIGSNINLGSLTCNVSDYPISSILNIQNYIDNGLDKPSTFLMNKYKEQLVGITITPLNAGETFISGEVTVWSET